MIDVGLIVLRGTRLTIEQKLPLLLRDVMSQIRSKLYVKLDVKEHNDLLELVPIVYRDASKVQNDVDLRILLNCKRRISIDYIFEEQNEYIPTKKVIFIF